MSSMRRRTARERQLLQCRGFRRIELIEEVAAARARPAGVSIAVVPLLDDAPDPLDLGARVGGLLLLLGYIGRITVGT